MVATAASALAFASELASQIGLVMLVLSRKVGERILIGDNIAVTVVRVGPGMVRIGVDAPRDYSIVREEIKDRQTKATAADGNGDGEGPAA